MSVRADGGDAGSAHGATALDRAALLDEITRLAQVEGPPDDDEVTVQELCREWSCSEQTARRRLQRAINAGLISKRMAVINGRSGYVYRIVE